MGLWNYGDRGRNAARRRACVNVTGTVVGTPRVDVLLGVRVARSHRPDVMISILMLYSMVCDVWRVDVGRSSGHRFLILVDCRRPHHT